MRYRVTRSSLIVTKPSGEVVQREIQLHFDTRLDTFGIRILGESPLSGYTFEVVQRELKRARDQGEAADTLPGVS